jgi:hypothetical protein
MNLGYDATPAIGMNVTITGSTTQTVRLIDQESVLNFYVEERVGDREPRDFWLEVKHNANDTYLSNKTSAINQSMKSSTTAVLSGTLTYEPPVIDPQTSEETSPAKNVLRLDDISLISTPSQNRSSAKSLTIPWMNSKSNITQHNPNKNDREPNPKRPRITLSQMPATQSLSTALQANPIPSSLIQNTSTPSDPTSENQTSTDPTTDQPQDN